VESGKAWVGVMEFTIGLGLWIKRKGLRKVNRPNK
jgi:hypothetical protein